MSNVPCDLPVAYIEVHQDRSTRGFQPVDRYTDLIFRYALQDRQRPSSFLGGQ